MNKKAVLDKLLDQWMSKKLTVFIVATAFVAMGSIEGAEWANIAITYIGTQGVIDAFTKIRGAS